MDFWKVSKINNKMENLNFTYWLNEIEFQKESKIFKDIKNKSHMYFVHSYGLFLRINQLFQHYDYSSKIVCAIEYDNLFGT